jgi:hypothetical protein
MGFSDEKEMTVLEEKWAANPPTTIVPLTPMAMIQIAVQQGADLDKLEKLMELQERWERNEARKAFVAAMAEFKKEPLKIKKNVHVKYGKVGYAVEYDHASLDNVCSVICAALSYHGLSSRWNTEQADTKIKVTCVLQHRQGHTESVTLEGFPDTSGSKNAIQSIGSTITYLQRYTLLAITGMATADQDDDGKASGQQEEELTKLDNLNERLDWIANCRDVEELRRIFADAYKEANKLHDTDAIKVLTKAKDARRAELTKEGK